MLAYKYDKDTKEYLGTQNAQVDPINKGYLLPAYATFIKPPASEPFKARVFKDEAWSFVKDFRKGFYKVDSNLIVTEITELGDIPEGYILVTEVVGDDIKANPNKYVIDDGIIREKSEEEKEKEEQTRIDNLNMTPLDFIKVLETMGLDLIQINNFLESNINIKMQLTYCNSVYCGVVKTFLPKTIEGVLITKEMVEEAFKTKNGVS